LSLWDRIVEPGGLSTVFQPIVSIDGKRRAPFAYEALTRGPKGTNVERSDVLFEYVRRKRRESEIDLLSMEAALREARHLPGVPTLSLNVHAATLERDGSLAGHLALLSAEHGIPLEQIIIEIVEHAPPWSGPQLLASLAELRALGVRIALDDVGLGQSNFRMILDCRPDLLKIDRHFVAGAHADPDRRAVVESIAGLAVRLGGQAVAEGIEDQRDLDAVIALGIDLVQGFLLCRPLSSSSLRDLGALEPVSPP
jgi:EAL domain-containing protein (putative c-di-GMP-specific phosphodiesterase class I)